MRKTTLFIFILLQAFAMTALAMPKLQLPSLISDHMVLQQGMPAPIWGKDKPGQTIIVSIADQTASSKAGNDGKWKAVLPVLTAGGPYELVVSGSESVTVKDVLVGEVWVASGQSNMELPLNNTLNAKKDVPAAHQSQIRWFVQERALSEKPLEEPKGTWKVCTPETAKDFSAAAYYFAKKIHQALNVPVGILGTYWGGTWIESWIPRETFKTNKSIQAILDRWDSLSSSVKKERGGLQDMELEICNLRFIPKDDAQEPLTVLLEKDASKASGKTLGGTWTSNAQPGSTITFISKSSGGPKPGPVGMLRASVQAGGWANSNTEFASGNRLVDLSAYSGFEFMAKGKGSFTVLLSQPIVTDWDNYGTEPFEATQSWKTYKYSFSQMKQSGWGLPKPFRSSALQAVFLNVAVHPMSAVPTGLFNGMVNPLIPYGIKGALWYQGETNVGQAEEYHRLLPAFIQGWRKAWGEGDFTFVCAQLPNFKDPNEKPGNGWPELREAQLEALKEPNTGMAVLIDVGEANDIHPKDKNDVGKRMALQALHLAYGKPGSYSGPLYDSMRVEGQKIRLKFKNADGGLRAKGKGPLKGFVLAGADGKFMEARAKIEDATVIVWNAKIKFPQAVRYAWADDPVCNLYGKSGLPASPFRTDNPYLVNKGKGKK